MEIAWAEEDWSFIGTMAGDVGVLECSYGNKAFPQIESAVDA